MVLRSQQVVHRLRGCYYSSYVAYLPRACTSGISTLIWSSSLWRLSITSTATVVQCVCNSLSCYSHRHVGARARDICMWPERGRSSSFWRSRFAQRWLLLRSLLIIKSNHQLPLNWYRRNHPATMPLQERTSGRAVHKAEQGHSTSPYGLQVGCSSSQKNDCRYPRLLTKEYITPTVQFQFFVLPLQEPALAAGLVYHTMTN